MLSIPFFFSSSHAVLEITVRRKQKGQYGSQVLRGKLALVDLAGR
jgi:kinesin family protein 18/19